MAPSVGDIRKCGLVPPLGVPFPFLWGVATFNTRPEL